MIFSGKLAVWDFSQHDSRQTYLIIMEERISLWCRQCQHVSYYYAYQTGGACWYALRRTCLYQESTMTCSLEHAFTISSVSVMQTDLWLTLHKFITQIISLKFVGNDNEAFVLIFTCKGKTWDSIFFLQIFWCKNKSNLFTKYTSCYYWKWLFFFNCLTMKVFE